MNIEKVSVSSFMRENMWKIAYLGLPDKYMKITRFNQNGKCKTAIKKINIKSEKKANIFQIINDRDINIIVGNTSPVVEYKNFAT